MKRNQPLVSMHYCFVIFCELLLLLYNVNSALILFLYVSINMKLLQNIKRIYNNDFMAYTEFTPRLIDFFGWCHTYYIVLLISSLAHFKNNNLKFACTRMELVNENLVLDLTENQNSLTNKHEKKFPGLRGRSSRSIRMFCYVLY